MSEMKKLRHSMARAAEVVRVSCFVTGSFVVALLIAGWVTGCAAVKPACLVIDAAHAVCTVLKYVDSSGVEHVVPVSKDELVEMGKGVELKRAGRR